MINKLDISRLRNAEYFQLMVSARDIFKKFDAASANLSTLYKELDQLLVVAEEALAAERRNEKIREKNEMDRYRDRLHSKLFNYLKSILFDERDPRFDAAQEVMQVVKNAGNPSRLPENVQSATLTTLGNRLEPLRNRLEAIGAQQTVDDLMEANRQFIILERESREFTASQKLSSTPSSMSAVRRLIDPIYRAVVAVLNGYSGVMANNEQYREKVTEMNVLIARYDSLLAARRREKAEQPANNQQCSC
ncbi:MAG: DUF6261 family protein [Dysgonamonadaceae bacterium]|jgi:hypothetical protein|nr:DUF6261 family protein [Dysgonamonadaceae bacterium]